MTGITDRPEAGGLRRTAMHGAAVIALAQICKIALQFLTLFVVSRFLAPVDFGIVAMVMPIVGLLPLLQDLGLQQALIQARSVTAEELSRIFWINLAIAFALGAALVLGGSFVAGLYAEPRVAPLIMSWALPVLMTAVASHHLGILNRQLRFREIALAEAGAAVATSVVAVAGAVVLGSYWAIYASALAGAATGMAIAWNATRWMPLSPAVRARTGHLLRFGAEVTGSDILTYLSRNLDNVIIASAFGPAKLGLYDLSYKLILLPVSHVNAPIGRVMQPLLGRIRDERARYRKSYLLVASAIAWTIVPGVCALAIAAPDVVPLLLGDQWAQAAPIFAWLGLAGLCNPLINTTGWLFVTQHRTREMLHWSVLSTATTVLSFFAGLPWGVTGVAAAYALSTVIVRTPLVFLLVGRRGPVTAADLWSVQAPVLLGAGSAFLLFFGAAQTLDLNGVTAVGSALALSYGLLAAILAGSPTSRARLGELAALGRNGLSGRRPSPRPHPHPGANQDHPDRRA